MANLQELYYQKALKQRENIRELLKNGTSASIEMPNHETLFDINVQWLKQHGIDVSIVTDRDGRPICLLDTSKILSLKPDFEKRYIEQPLFGDENVR